MYNPSIGKFLSVDPLQQKYPNLSPYSFVDNSPIINVDPDGRYIKYSITYDDDGKPVITISVTGKVIDYATGNWFHNAKDVAKSINNVTWLNDDGEGVDISGIPFRDDNGDLIEFADGTIGTVKFEFDFTPVESIIQADLDDHIIAIADFDGMKASGVTNLKGGKVVHVSGDAFTGLSDRWTGRGEVVVIHELITHAMGIEHTGNDRKVTNDNSVKYYSTDLSKKSIVKILRNLGDYGENQDLIKALGITPLNQGSNRGQSETEFVGTGIIEFNGSKIQSDRVVKKVTVPNQVYYDVDSIDPNTKKPYPPISIRTKAGVNTKHIDSEEAKRQKKIESDGKNK